jgi:hypothetical protein
MNTLRVLVTCAATACVGYIGGATSASEVAP